MRCARVAGLVLSLALLVTSLPGLAADPYEINVVLSMTGPGSFLGKNEAAALALIEQNTNKAGGIGGRPIKFVVVDDQSSPQVAVQLTNNILAKNPPVVLGSTLVAACTAMAAMMKNGPVLYCFSAGMHPEKGTYAFTYGVSTTDLIGVTVRYFRDHGWKRLGIITSTDASGQDGEKSIDQILALPENKDMSVAAREHYAVADVSVVAQLSHIKSTSPQAVIAWGTGTPFGTVLHGAADVGLDVPMSGSASNLTYAQMKQFGPFLPKELDIAGLPSITLGSIPPGPLRKAVQDYVDAFQSTGVRPDIAQAISWDPGLIVVAAFKKLGLSATAAQIKDYISNLHGWAGANGVYDFRDGSQRGLTSKNGIMVRWDPAKDTWVSISKFGGAPL
ncbi:MAG TPA: ABC transporter substrate-binding protein [Candidatus Binatia bacterium]|nr:ABC transporter substrate-binding protein [Candidatus Binatia bacterium]